MVRILDIPAARVHELLPLAEAFYGEGDLPGSMDPRHFCSFWIDALYHGRAILLAAEVDGQLVGSIGAILGPDERDGSLVAYERHWYVSRAFRGSTNAGIRLKQAYEAEAVRRGALRCSMAHLANATGEKLAPMFKADGYVPVETHYIRELVQPDARDLIRCIDGFVQGPNLLRRAALKRDFCGHEFAGHVYKGVAPADDLAPTIQNALFQWGIRAEIALSFFRSGRAEGDEPTTYIHADNAVETAWAGVLYLTPDELCRGGTAFWRHRELNWERLPERVSPELAERLNRDGQDEAAWERYGLAEMRYNRFVMYPTDVFHSRYPREGFGSELEDGRLVYVCFFNITED